MNRSASGARPQGGDEVALGIGALSRASGVPVETLRTWERRYGFPQPLDRDGSSHRRYPLEAVERLRLVKRALAQGHKPAMVVGAERDHLRELLALDEEAPAASDRRPASDRGGGPNQLADLETWFEAVRRFDAGQLDAALAHAWDARGAMSFLSEHAGPFLVELGKRWESGELSVMHEHFASERVRDFLVSHRLRLGTPHGSRGVVCATLPDEQHTLAAHMAAIACILAGAKVLFLGANTPVGAIAEAALQTDANAVVLSVTTGYDPERLLSNLTELRGRLPRSVAILAGGAGMTVEVEGVRGLATLEQLKDQVVAL